MNNNINRSRSTRDERPLDPHDLAIIRVAALSTDPRHFAELTTLMKTHDAGVVGSFLLYADDVMFFGPSLSEQFERRYIDSFGSWKQASNAVIGFFCWDVLVENGVIERDEPFDEFLTQDDEVLRTFMRGLNMQLIDTGEVIALFFSR